MSKDLEEYTDLEIANEYRRRFHLINSGQCTYCLGKVGMCGCKMNRKRGMANGELGVLVSGIVADHIRKEEQRERQNQQSDATSEQSASYQTKKGEVQEPAWLNEPHLTPEARRKARQAKDMPKAEDFVEPGPGAPE